jgi:hypothetical protein
LPVPSRTGSSALPLTVDGAKTPELVPDSVAYRHFVMALAEREDAAESRLERRNARLNELGLSTKDRASLLTALRTVRERLDRIAEDRKSIGSSGSSPAMAALRLEHDEVVGGAVDRIKTFLSQLGRARVETYLREHVKRNIVIYGAVPK